MAPFTVDYRANFSDTDAAGIVHFSTVFFWVEATEEALFRHLKLPFLRTEGAKITGFPRVRVECDFLSPIYRERGHAPIQAVPPKGATVKATPCAHPFSARIPKLRLLPTLLRRPEGKPAAPFGQ